ncbi:hypothetical protein AAC387_Pa05g1982 [Persea americana]
MPPSAQTDPPRPIYAVPLQDPRPSNPSTRPTRPDYQGRGANGPRACRWRRKRRGTRPCSRERSGVNPNIKARRWTVQVRPDLLEVSSQRMSSSLEGVLEVGDGQAGEVLVERRVVGSDLGEGFEGSDVVLGAGLEEDVVHVRGLRR